MKENTVLKITLAGIAAGIAALAAAFGIFWAIRCNVIFEGPVLAGYGFNEGIYPVEKITAADLAVVEDVLGANGISYKLGEEENVVIVRTCNEEKARELLRNSGYNFDGYVFD